MLQRKPTRIELRPEDAKEVELLVKEREAAAKYATFVLAPNADQCAVRRMCFGRAQAEKERKKIVKEDAKSQLSAAQRIGLKR